MANTFDPVAKPWVLILLVVLGILWKIVSEMKP